MYTEKANFCIHVMTVSLVMHGITYLSCHVQCTGTEATYRACTLDNAATLDNASKQLQMLQSLE